MDLAVETRLQIYNYLLTPSLTERDRAKLDEMRRASSLQRAS